MAQVSSQKKSPAKPDMSSLGATAAVKNSAAESSELAGMNGLVVVTGPAGTNGPARKLEYCCPVCAEGDQRDDSAEARAGGASARVGAGPDEAAAKGTGARRRREGATARGFSPCDSNKNSSPSSVTLW